MSLLNEQGMGDMFPAKETLAQAWRQVLWEWGGWCGWSVGFKERQGGLPRWVESHHPQKDPEAPFLSLVHVSVLTHSEFRMGQRNLEPSERTRKLYAKLNRHPFILHSQ